MPSANRNSHRSRHQNACPDKTAKHPRVTVRLTPLASALSMLMAFGVLTTPAQATPAFGSAWFAAKGAAQSQALANGVSIGGAAGIGAQTQAQVEQQAAVRQSINNLNRAAASIAAAQAMQAAAREAALAGPSPIPDGLTQGGLQVDTNALTRGWLNAAAPVASVTGGQTTVTVTQTAQKAILNWSSFNIGRNTTLYFNQSAGNQSSGANDWIVLNRINDPQQRPSQIAGQIKAEGTVYVLNRNGIIFGAGSQVNTHSLLASTLSLFSSDVDKSDAFFLQNGIGQSADTSHILTQNSTIDGFLVGGANADGTVAAGDISVEPGATITTGTQGYALIAAANITQGGNIMADNGQVFLVANGQVGYVPSPHAGDGLFSVDGGALNGSALPGKIINTGFIEARQGNVQWLGSDLMQSGTVVVSTSLTQPGSIAFDSFQLGRNSSGAASVVAGQGNIVLGAGSVTTILPEKDGETTSSSAAADAAFKSGAITMAGNTITLNNGAFVEAPGAAVTLTAASGSTGAGRVYIDDGATIDVSGLSDVELPMADLLVTIPRIGQNELADSPLLRNGFLYTQKNVVIDSTQSGTRADGLNWIGSPILNVAGYVDDVPRSIEQLLTTGGSITLVSSEVIARTGSQLLLNGGYVAYQPGWVNTPNLLGANGLIYGIDNADPEMTYVGFAGQYTLDHSRWGVTDTYVNPLLAGLGRWDAGFIQGYDAGTLTIEPSQTPVQPVLDGTISAQAYTGRNQALQGDAPKGGSLILTNIDLTSVPNVGLGAVNFVISDQPAPLEDWQPGFTAGTPLKDIADGNPLDPNDPFYWRTLSAAMLNEAGFSTIKMQSGGTIQIAAGTTLSVQPGGTISLTASKVDVQGALQARSGSVILNSFANQDSVPATPSEIVVGPAGLLDTSGLWVNDSGLPGATFAGREFVNGGNITLASWQGGGRTLPDLTGNIDLQSGSVLDVSSGGYAGANAQLAMQNDVPIGKGGDITIGTHIVGGLVNYGGGGPGNAPAELTGGTITLDGALLSDGFSGGGTLSLHAPEIQIGGTPNPSPDVALLYLPADFFTGQGFSAYKLEADTDAIVAPGTHVQVQSSYLLPNYQALLAAPTGTDLHASDASHPAGLYATVGALGSYQRWLGAAGDEGLSLTAGDYLKGWSQFGTTTGKPPPYAGVSGSVLVGEGASIAVDAGGTVSLTAANQLTVLGTVTAPGGTISLNNFSLGSIAPAYSIWLGSNSVLDASGTVLLNPLAALVPGADNRLFVPATGTVLDGGSVSLTSNGYLLAQPGATIDVSGTDAVFDLPTAARRLGAAVVDYAPAPVWSDAGSIMLAASGGMLFDATLQAQAGAPEAEGGSLTIAGYTPSGSAAAGAMPQAIVLQAAGNLLPANLAPGDIVEPALSKPSGILRFAVDRLNGSGITSLVIGPTPGDGTSENTYSVLPLLFAGDVSLTLARSFTADASAYIATRAGNAALPPTATPIVGAGSVSISAPYVDLTDTRTSPATVPAPLPGDGTLNVDAAFIDLGGTLLLQGFGQANFESSGDLRFYLPASDVYFNSQPRTGWLYSTGDLSFSASRLYPASDYSFLIDANPRGLNADGSAQETTVTFRGNGTSDTTTPLSAGGTLAVAASHIEQDGTLWVPSGSIILGVTDPASELAALGLTASFASGTLSTTESVRLAPGSVTSVSLDGQILPYGSTTDGTDWSYNADPGITAPDLSAPPAKQIAINGGQISLESGATIDLSGGGDLQAEEWVPGSGGTRDVLSQYETNFAGGGAASQVPQYADGRAIYAIVPGYRTPVSAQDAALEKGAGAGPAVGQSVYLSGMPGLPAGVYTLLPAKYATLPGAYRVVQNTGASDSVLGYNATMLDGTENVAGYFTDALSGARAALNTSFLIQSGPVWQQYSQYDLTQASTYFSAQAQRAGTVPVPLPIDAGHLSLGALTSLELGAALTAPAASGGRGAQVDIAGQAIQIVGAGSDGLDGYLHLDADGLTRLGAASLLIGGTRSASAQGDILDVTAGSVVLSNDAADPLYAPEVILVANGQGSGQANAPAGGIDIESGSVLRASGNLTAADAVPLLIGSMGTDAGAGVSGDGALVRVANGAPAAITRVNVTGIDGPAGAAGGALTIADGALVDGGDALSLDATGNTRVGAGALLSGRAIDVAANLITFVNTVAGDDRAGLLIGPNTLAQFGAADSVILRSRSTIDFAGNIEADFDHSLTLSAAALTSDGGVVNIGAGTLILTNEPGSTAASFWAGNGQLNVMSGELDFGNGSMTLQGFGSVDSQSSAGIAAQGNGAFDFGNLNVTLDAPVVLADTGAKVSITTTGALNVGAAAGTALTRASLAGSLVLTGGSVDVSTNVYAPAGNLTVHATTGDLSIENEVQLSVAGVAKTFNDTQSYSPGGTLTLDADAGNINVSPRTVLNVAADSNGGNAGQLVIQATTGAANLQGALLGSAATGYLGGYFTFNTAAVANLDALADTLSQGGMNGSVSIQTGAGNLELSADSKLIAHSVTLVANGGSGGAAGDGGLVLINGTVDASGTFGGPINLYGKEGVDIEGALLANATADGRNGGNIALGTTGAGDGTLNAAYGYENVQAAGSGTIRIGPLARLDLSGSGGNGSLSLRAPLLANGDVNVSIDSGALITAPASVSLEAYATWSTADTGGDPAKHFDGLVDPAGWYAYDSNGKVQLVAGSWTDSAGNPEANPDPTDSAQMADYLVRYNFTPAAANADHQTFYGYVNGDAAQGPGTVMGFVQAPGFAFESRFAGISNFHAQPGIDLINPNQSINNGDIAVLTPWNLGAGTTHADGVIHQVYRYGNQAPVLSLRADNNLDIRASITDGFYQIANVAGAAKPRNAGFDEATADWQLVIDTGWAPYNYPALFSPPADPSTLVGGDPQAISEYYGQYVNYATYLATSFSSDGSNEFFGITPTMAIVFGLGFGSVAPVPNVPAPPVAPTNLNQYPKYLASYEAYLFPVLQVTDFPITGILPDNATTLSPPPTTLDLIDTSAPTDNSPSPSRVASNPLPLPSATLGGGSSSSYRFVAGADTGSANPLAVQAAAVIGKIQSGWTGQLNLDGHTDYTDPTTGRVLLAPTLVRTGTGSIDMAAAGDIRWLDTAAPAAVYTAGTSSDGTSADPSAALLQPSIIASPVAQAPELVVTGAVNPTGAGDISLNAGGDIVGIQQVVDADGRETGVAGTPITQYWWQWMQTGNSADGSRSSINFGAFDQGVMSVGGNVNVSAGGDIRELSVSLPTTWYANSDMTAVTTVGGGNLNVRAGGDILSGTYFVSRGQGTITAGGSIGSDFDFTADIPNGQSVLIPTTMPVATLLALQDSQLQVQAVDSVNIGGVYNPSWLTSGSVDALLPTGHADGQSYSAASSLSVSASSGDLTYGSLRTPSSLFSPLVSAITNDATAGNVLPATIAFAAPSGNIDILAAGELYPSAEGNLTMLADGSISFVNTMDREQSQSTSWGMIDAPASLLPSPLDTRGLISLDAPYLALRQNGYIDTARGGTDAYGIYLHSVESLHGADSTPVRIYALDGDIVDGVGSGAGVGDLLIAADKPALIQAGRDIVDLLFQGQQTHQSDLTVIAAGRDIYDTPQIASTNPIAVAGGASLLPVILQAGSGTLLVQAGRNIGPLSNQTEFYALGNVRNSSPFELGSASSQVLTGIDTIGNAYNPYLPSDGANIQVQYGVAPGIAQADFIAKYIDPSSAVTGVPSLIPALVTFMQNYVAGLAVDTGYVADNVVVALTPEQAWAQFQTLPAFVQSLFVEKALFTVLTDVGADYNNAASPFFQQYARGYAAIDTLFPASLGYTANGSGQGGLNGATQTVDTGDLDIRGSTIQTQQGGDVGILAPGGQALLGSTSAPALITDNTGRVVAGPNTMGLLTLRQGAIDIFTDRSVLLAQSRIFTEQGGDVVAWSSNGDINAGQGAKTTTELATASYLCSPDLWCELNPDGQVSGAGIGTLQTIAGAPTGNVFLMAPRGTVDAGDAGIRFSGNLVIAAAKVLNADNITGQGTITGIPIEVQTNVGALTAADTASVTAVNAAADMTRQQQAAAGQAVPSIITVQVLGFGDEAAAPALAPPAGATSASAEPARYNPNGSVVTLGVGASGQTQQENLSARERRDLGL